MNFAQIDLLSVYSLQNIQNQFLDLLTLTLSWITEGGFLWFFICFLIFLFDKKERKRKIFLILLALLLSNWVVNIPFKMIIFCRKRPYEALKGIRVLSKVWENCSFPSGHLAVSSAALFTIGYLFRLKNFLFILSSIFFLFLLGFSRIYVGMHYLTDVLAGVLVGIVCALVIIYFDKQIRWN